MNKIAALIVTGELEVKFKENEDLKEKVSELQELIKTGNIFDVAIYYGRFKEFIKAYDINVTNYMDDLYKFICKSEKELNMSIEDLNLSARTYNCLFREGIKTVGDLTKMSKEKLGRVRNLGQKAFDEVIENLSICGFELEDE